MDYIPSNYLITLRVDEAIETKYLAQGHKHVGTSGARTHWSSASESCTVPLDHTRSPNILLPSAMKIHQNMWEQ